jgi:hypothetical protein
MGDKIDTIDLSRTSVSVRASIDVHTTSNGEKSLAIQTSIEVSENSVWKKWYERQDDKHVER